MCVCHGALAQAPQLRHVALLGPVCGGQLAPALALALARGPPPSPRSAVGARLAFTVDCGLEAHELEGARRVLEAAGKVRSPERRHGRTLPGCVLPWCPLQGVVLPG